MTPILIEVSEDELPKFHQQWLSLNTNELNHTLNFIPYKGEGADMMLKFIMIVFLALSLLTAIPSIYGWVRMLIGLEYDGASVVLLPALAIPFGIIATNYYKRYQKLRHDRTLVESGTCIQGVFYDHDAMLVIHDELCTLIPKNAIQKIDEKLTKNNERSITIIIQNAEQSPQKIKLPLTSRKEVATKLQNWKQGNSNNIHQEQ